MKSRGALVIAVLLTSGSAFAADLRSDAETLLRRMATDPEATYVVQSAKQAAIAQQDDEVTIKIAGLALAPRTNPAAGIAFGDVVIHVHRRADGGVEASADLPKRIALRGAKPPAGGQLGVENGKLVLGWGTDLESDRVQLTADSMAEISEDGKPGATAIKPSFSVDRTAAKGSAGRFAFSLDGVHDDKGQAPVSVQGFGPFMIEGHYENFPAERYRLLLRHILLWEQFRAPRGDVAVSLGGLEQGMALLQEAGMHYAIDKMRLKFGATSLQAEADIHFSLEAANGVTGSATAWLVETQDGAQPAPANPAAALGTQMAGQFAVAGKAPDGADAKVFHVELAADGSAKLNGQPAPGLATGISSAFMAFAQGWAGRGTASIGPGLTTTSK